MYTTPKQFRIPAFMLVFLFSFSFIFVSAYKIMDYSDFSVDAHGKTELNAQGWYNRTTGLSSAYNDCYIGNGALRCYSTQGDYILRDWSTNNIIARNGSNPPQNFSVRFKFGWDVAGNTGGSGATRTLFTRANYAIGAPLYEFYYSGNVTGMSEYGIYGSIDGSKKIFSSVPYDNTFREFQIDYVMWETGSGTPNMSVYNATLWFENINHTWINASGVASICDYYNTTAFTYPNSKSIKFDDFLIIAYDMNEPFLAAKSAIPLPIIINNQPNFNVKTKDKNSFFTSFIKPTLKCEMVYDFSTGTYYLHPDCNPLYFEPYNIYDSENNSLYYALVCDANLTPVYKNDFASELDLFNHDLLELSANTTISYYDSVNRGIIFTNRTDIIQKMTSYFTNDNFNKNVLVNWYSNNYLITFDAKLSLQNKYDIVFYDTSINEIINISMDYTSSGTFDTYFQNVPTDSVNGFNINSVYNIGIMIYPSDSTYQLIVRDSSDNVFYTSNKHSFNFNLPIYSMRVNIKDNGGGFAGNNEVFGNFIVGGFKKPVYTAYNLSSPLLNCTEDITGDYTAHYFIADASHLTSFTNYENINYHVGNVDVNNEIIGSLTDAGVEQSIDDMFMGSQTAKYLFAFALFLMIVIGSFMISSRFMDSGVSAAIMACFAGVMSIIFMVVLKILPVWILISVFFVFAVIAAMAMRSWFSGGGGASG